MTRPSLWCGCCVMGMVAALAGCGKSEGEAPVVAAPPAPAALPTSFVEGKVHTPAPAQTTEQGDPIVVFHTTEGDIFVRLYERLAPRTVANFLDYARHRHYDGTIFHHVEGGYLALGGGFDAQLQARPIRYPIANEANNGLKNVRGALAMSRDPKDPNSASSQFFINLADNPKLDHRGTKPEEFGFCVFGQVIDGLDVLDRLNKVETAPKAGFEKMPVRMVTLNSVRPVR